MRNVWRSFSYVLLKTLLDIYNLAVNDQPYSFLYVNLRAKSPNDMFYIRFEKKLLIE
jgi:hypothetical protein